VGSCHSRHFTLVACLPRICLMGCSSILFDPLRPGLAQGSRTRGREKFITFLKTRFLFFDFWTLTIFGRITDVEQWFWTMNYGFWKTVKTTTVLGRLTPLDNRRQFREIQSGSKVRRQTATTHGGGLGESFEVGKPCPETHRYAPVSTFLERMNVRLAITHSSGQRARSGMRSSFASFHWYGVCQCSSMVP